MFELDPMLVKFKDLLEMEEHNTIRYQFDSFVNGSLAIDDKNTVINIYDDFLDFLALLDDEIIDSPKKIKSIMNSKFINEIMCFKHNAREKELRRLTYDLSEFIGGLGHDRKNPTQQALSSSLKDSAGEIKPRRNKKPKESMNDAWRRELASEVVKRFK